MTQRLISQQYFYLKILSYWWFVGDVLSSAFHLLCSELVACHSHSPAEELELYTCPLSSERLLAASVYLTVRWWPSSPYFNLFSLNTGFICTNLLQSDETVALCVCVCVCVCVATLAESQIPHQRLNLGPGSESTESLHQTSREFLVVAFLQSCLSTVLECRNQCCGPR